MRHSPLQWEKQDGFNRKVNFQSGIIRVIERAIVGNMVAKGWCTRRLRILTIQILIPFLCLLLMTSGGRLPD